MDGAKAGGLYAAAALLAVVETIAGWERRVGGRGACCEAQGVSPEWSVALVQILVVVATIQVRALED